MNQGKFIEEVIQLNNFTEMEAKTVYLDLRNQRQKLGSYLLKCKIIYFKNKK